MAKRIYRYVNDHGEIFRMTETRFSRYLLAGTTKNWPDPAKFGVLIGSAVTVNNFTPDCFRNAFNELHRERLLERARLVMSVKCPTCDAPAGEQCQRTGKRFERVYFRGSGASTRDALRKLPHDSRTRLAVG